MRLLMALGALVAMALLTSCTTMPTKFDGTWLFMIDLEVDVSGDCTEDDWDVTGTSNQIVDIYSSTDGGLVVMFEQILDGTYQNNEFEAIWERVIEYEDAKDTDRVTMTGSYGANALSGEVEDYEKEVAGSDSWECTQTFTYTAERINSNDDRYVGN